MSHNCPCFRVVQYVGGLVPFVGRVYRHADGAHHGEAEPAVEKLGAVGQEQCYPVPFGDSKRLEHCTGLANLVQAFPVGNTLSRNLQKDLFRILGCAFPEKFS